jgi:excisionase family DNA binding protein
MMREYISVAEAAELLDVSQKVVRSDINRGRLPAYRVGRLVRIRIADIQELKQPVAPTRGGAR